MAYSYVRYTGNDSTTNYTFSFPYISEDHIKVRIDGDLVTTWSFLNSSTIQFVSAPTAGSIIEIRRETPKSSTIVNFTDGSVLLERDLDLLATFDLYLAQETEDSLGGSISQNSLGQFDALNKRIINVADPVNAQDAVTKTYADAVIAQSAAAATDAAAVQVSLAATQASNSASSAVAAAASATSSANSATASASSASAAAASYDSFDDRYLGAKSAAPSTDNDGQPLITGTIYWDTPSSQMFTWNGSSWRPTFLIGNTVRTVVTATAGQTVVPTPTYLVGSNTLQVFVNGAKFLLGVDYTETTQNSITAVSGLSLGDEVELIAQQSFAVDELRADLASNGASKGANLVAYDSRTVAEVIKNLELTAKFDSNNGYVGLTRLASSAMILGDSITEAAGASSYVNGYAYQVARSIINARDKGFLNDPGFGWHTDVNQANAVNTGLTTTGTLSTTGLVANRRSLAAGQSITVTGRAFATVYVAYDGAASTGSLVIARNGTTLSTQAVSGTTLNQTSAVTNTWSESDTLTITASGGTVVVCGVLTIKTAAAANLLYVAGKSGYAYQDYTTTAALDEIAYWLNLFRSSSEKLLVLNLGTNNLYNSGKARTPAAMVAEIAALIAGVNTRCSSVKYIISVPPKANESTFPIQSSGYEYADYVNAIVEFAESNGHGLLRHDLSILSRRTDYYSDGVHPNNLGHRVMAQTVCETLGVVLDPYVRTTVPTDTGVAQADVTMNGTWAAFTGSSAFRAKAHISGNTVVLSGIVAPNGSASTTLGTLPVGYRPIGRTCYLIGRSDAGAVALSINTNGEVILVAVPTTWFSLEGITFAVTRT